MNLEDNPPQIPRCIALTLRSIDLQTMDRGDTFKFLPI